ncbi:hypothetical protein EDB81DRAFT_899466 [Dactylonectria macrodidyma]|uniref:Azaphilone pigments biosynthesis cluster protein L N-terminal domain-containing protein n=1 Tax=Dactylonectria macrodidyma TaxID=307937 RepID=A0A9P9J1I6_9HYPO|nr:hypothetical protein EDB81DRAFT_899466 [Dactylonectria macrodidyma]
MADPLSVTGLAIGVVSLGLQVSGAITTYIDALNCRDKDIASVRQQNDSLQKTLQALESLLSQFQRDHQVATTAVHECLGSCKKELNAMESLVAEVTACDQSASSRKNKFKNQGKKLLYPFSRRKVEELEIRISNANATLQLALQTLGLVVSHLSTEKLTTLEATSHNITASLLAVQSKVSAMNSPLQGIHSTMSGFDRRFDTLETLVTQLLVPQQAKNGSSQGITPAVAAGRLLGKPGVLRDICDAAEAQARPRSNEKFLTIDHGTTQFGNNVWTYTGGSFSCICHHRRRVQRKNVVWGSLALSFNAATEQHLPECPANQVMVGTDRSQKFTFTYTGLRHMLNSAIQLSFAMQWGAGAWSLSPNFTYYPTVDSGTAPAFRILSLLKRSRCYDRLSYALWWEKLIPLAVSAILRLFRAQKASPRAVDANNRSLVNHLARCAKPSPLLELLECLLVNKAPANDHDLSGYTPLSDMFRLDSYVFVTDPLPAAAAELILRSNSEANVACLSKPHPVALSTTLDLSGHPVITEGTVALLHFLASSTRIAEVEYLVRNHPTTLAERNLFGHTPLHLAADKPSCLRLLVEVADARLLNQTDDASEIGGFEMSALETAVSLSGLRCREPTRRHRKCRRCRCAECTVILLKADCALPVSANLQGVFSPASKRCKLRYIRHVKDRRDRLKQLALENLPATEVDRLGLASKRVLDSLASQVIQLLQDRGVCIAEALAVARNGPSSVYQALRSPWDAELFFRVGFHDTDSWYNVDATELNAVPNLPYLHWLARSGAISCQLNSFASSRDVITARFIFWKIGIDLMWHSPYKCLNLSRFAPSEFSEWSRGLPPDDRIVWIHELHAAALPANTADSCLCKCSLGGCTALTSLLKGVVGTHYHLVFEPEHFTEDSVAEDTDSEEDSIVEDTDRPVDSITGAPGRLSELIATFAQYLMLFGGDLEVRHHTAALRYLTFTALHIPHTCCDPYYNRAWRRCRALFPEDVSEVEDEHAYELALLEELLGEFEREIIAILQNPDWKITDLVAFWKRTWVSRMWDILGRLHGSDLEDDERRGAEKIGVIWDRTQPPKVQDNPYEKRTLDFWKYELEKIEAGC